MIHSWGISNEIALTWKSQDSTDDKSTLAQVMAWCLQATSHYLSQCWPRSLSPYGVTRPQWVNPTDDEYCSREEGQYHGNWCPGSLLHQFRHIQYLKYLWRFGIVMTSSNGSLFHVTSPLWGEPPVTGGFQSQRSVMRSFDVSLICAWTNSWVNNRDAGDLRRHHAYYNISVMIQEFFETRK